jgi:DNA-binding LacI/PurR family transcriptional regulator
MADGRLTSLARQWIVGIREAVSELGSHLSIFTAKEHCDEDHLFRQTLKSREIDGVIFLGASRDDGYYEYAFRCGTPCVLYNRRSDTDEFSWVSMDNEGSGRAAAEHLISQGHQQVAVCGNPDLKHTMMRRDGALAAMRDAGLKPQCVSNLHFRMTDEEFEEEIDRILKSEPTGVIVSDWSGARCIDALAARNIVIPKNVSVIDFDDMCQETTTGQKLTSMSYDKKWVGRMLGHVMARLVTEWPQLRSIGETFATYVVERDTTGPSPK